MQPLRAYKQCNDFPESPKISARKILKAVNCSQFPICPMSPLIGVLLICATCTESKENELFQTPVVIETQASKYVVERCAFYKIRGKGILLKTTDNTAFTIENCGFVQCRDTAVDSDGQELAMRLCCFDACVGGLRSRGDKSTEVRHTFILNADGGDCISIESNQANIESCNVSGGFAEGAVKVASESIDLKYIVSIGLSTSCWLSVTKSGGEQLLQSSLVAAAGSSLIESVIEAKDSLWVNNCGIFTAGKIVKMGQCTFVGCLFSGSEEDVKEKAGDKASFRDCKYRQDQEDFKTENPPRSDQCWALIPTPVIPNSSNGLIIGGVVTLLLVSVAVVFVVWKCLWGNQRGHKKPLLYV